MKKRLLCLAMALCLCCPQAMAAVVQETALHESLQKEINAISRNYAAIGVSVAYVRDGEVVDTFAYGDAVRYKTPMTADSIVRAASVSKVLVGLAAHVSAENGVMDLDASVDQYLGFDIYRRHEDDQITARSILTHTSSIAPPEVDSGKYEDMRKHLTSRTATLYFPSGLIKNWNYMNYPFYVLGLAIERANNKTMDQVMNEAFADKLAIDGSFWAGDLKNPERTAAVYNQAHEVFLSVEAQTVVHSRGIGVNNSIFAGNYHISAYDMGKIVAMLAADGCYGGERIISEQVVAAMEAYQPEIVPKNKFYQAQPLRYRTDIYGREGLYYHTGSAYGENNLIAYDPVAGDGVVIFSNGASGKDAYGIYAVCGYIADLLFNADWP
ncbi:MAG: serine hydrolase [Clostridia bacterium]|nr:serine hydrolase [Clostridia bacterium]